MEDVNRLIHEIYEASLDQDHWSEVLTTLAEIVGGCHTHLVLADLRADTQYVNILLRSDPAGAEEYLRDYAATDFRAPRVLSAQPGLMRDERSYVSAEDARTSIIHNEFLPRFGIHNIAGANMRIDDCFGWFGISTPRKDTPFSERQIALLAAIAPHIHRALRIAKTQRDLERRCNSLQAAHDIVGLGLVTFRNGKAITANEAACAIFADRFLNLRDGKLVCADRTADSALESLSAGRGPSTIALNDVDRGLRHLLRRHPAPAGSARFFTISISPTHAPGPVDFSAVAAFCAGSGVTTAEARALHASLSDVELADLARHEDVRLATVRKQLKSALSKLGMKGQKQLHRAFAQSQVLGRHAPDGG